MFYLGKDSSVDPEKMTAKEIARVFYDTIYDEDINEIIEFDITEAQYRKAVDAIESIINWDKKITKIDQNTLIGFKQGLIYGMALVAKLSVGGDDLDTDKVKAKMKQFVFMPWAIDKACANWKDDKWFENLMKNVTAVPEKPKKK